jgi:uncharacterized protein YkwD
MVRFKRLRGLEIINFTFIREIFESGASDFENRNTSLAYLTRVWQAQKSRRRWLKNPTRNGNVNFSISLMIFAIFCLISHQCFAGAGIMAKINSEILTSEESELISLTNKVRTKAHLPPFKVDWQLMHAARDHSWHMAFHNFLSHDLQQKTFMDRIKESGYDYTTAGENIAQSQQALPHVIELWMKSPGHRKNILHSQHEDIGVGIATSLTGKKYLTQVFASGD